MVTVGPPTVTVRGNRWSLYTNIAFGVGGDTVGAIRSAVAALQQYSTDIIIHGYSVRSSIAAGGTVTPYLFDLGGQNVYLTPFTVGVGGANSQAYYPLNLAHTMRPGDLEYLCGAGSTWAAVDGLQLRLWGEFMIPQVDSASSLQPVSLEGYKWPLSRR